MAEENLSTILKSAAGLIQTSVGSSSSNLAYSNAKEDVVIQTSVVAEENLSTILKSAAGLIQTSVGSSSSNLAHSNAKEDVVIQTSVVVEENLSTILKSAAGLIQTSVGSSSSNLAYSNAKEDVEELRRMVLRIRATLDDAEERDVRDEATKLWLKELKDLAYDAEDIVDEYDYEVLRSSVQGQNRFETTTHKRKREEVCNVITSTISIPNDYRDRIKEIRNKFDEITRDRDALRLTEEDGEKLSRSYETAKLPPTTSFVHESDVYGRKQDKEKVIEQLLAEGESSQRSVSVIPIIGMGGIGKTTLAQIVYNDSRVCQYFSQRGWACVSENFDVVRLLRVIFESLTKEPCNLTNPNVLCEKLRIQLEGKRFLLILDDVWNEKLGLWELVKAPLSDVGIGKIIVTTRHESVARIMQTAPPYRLGLLPEDVCWSLFRDRALEGRDPNEHANLEEIGKKIVRKCGGLPLAVRTLASLLRFEPEEEGWTYVLDSALWELDKQKDDILPALRLSYIRMPARLKGCFVYCSMFPKGYKFDRDHIVKLWMSQGLIQSRGRQQLEDTGDAYFEGLICRSFFQNLEELILGKVRYVMHDLLHDLAQSMAKEECYSTEVGLFHNMPKRVRHLSLFLPSEVPSEEYMECLVEYRDVRTLEITSPVAIQNNLFQKLTCLRALDLRHVEELPDSIGNLKHLRYLGLRDTTLTELPDSICCLYNLLVLEVFSPCLEELPKDMKNLINLRHLDVGSFNKICLPSGIGRTTSLQTLTGFEVGRDDQHCGIGELKDLVHLRGRLEIEGLDNVPRLEDAKEAQMDNKKHLEFLKFQWWYERLLLTDEKQGLTHAEFMEQMLENLRPHTNLKELTIRGYGGRKSPSWLGDPSFSKLVRLEIKDCTGASLPPLGQLPSLEAICFERLSDVKSVGREFCVGHSVAASGFPSLLTLTFRVMLEWVEWHGVKNGDFPRLKSLKFEHCPKLTSHPACLPSSLERLDIISCPALHFSIEDPLPPMLQPIEVSRSPGVRMWCRRKGIPYKVHAHVDDENILDDQNNEYSKDDGNDEDNGG